MRARYHGEQPTISQIVSSPRMALLATTTQSTPTVGYMFPELVKDPANRLPEGPDTVAALLALGVAMAEPHPDEARDSNIAAAFTYFGQFIDHDITKTLFDSSVTPPGLKDPIENGQLKPIDPANAGVLVKNDRSFQLDLDSLYGGLAKKEATQADGSMLLSNVQELEAGAGPIATDDLLHDLPRRPLIPDPVGEQQEEEDRQALIGDPRNDENLIVAQLHVAFLRAHNTLVKRGLTGEEAQVQLRRRYQWAVIHDFLTQICDPSLVKDILDNGATAWKVDKAEELFMPLEFSSAAYRFGHSMIRGEYSHNATFQPSGGLARATFNFMFTFTALSGDLQPGPGHSNAFATLPNNWIIDWQRFFDTKQNAARSIDTHLTPELATLRDFMGTPIPTLMGKLAARNLLRGYLLALPTGQAVARHLGLPLLDRSVLLDAIPGGQRRIVEAAGLLERTPLWFYVLAEAGDSKGPNGNHLGPLGSRLVAETLINICRFSPDSVLVDPPNKDELDSGEFTLKGIIRLGLDTAFTL